jgi:GH35 family endo-1,4-beta-xylanase
MTSIKEGNDPYIRSDPGIGLQRVPVYRFDLGRDFNLWKSWRTNDGRVLPSSKSGFSLINDPFEIGQLILLTTYFDPAVAGKSFGGFGMRAPINPAVALNNHTFIEFEFYYPENVSNSFMRFEIWSTTSGGEGSQAGAGSPGANKTQVYIRTTYHDGVGNLDRRSGFYNGKTWYKYTICASVPVSTGSWEFLNIDLHTENGTKVDGDQLMIGNIRITQLNQEGMTIPEVVNEKKFSEVEPIRKMYNLDNGYFMVGVTGTGAIEPDSIRGYHYEIFVDENNLKPECHVRPPQWLKEEYPGFVFKIAAGEEIEGPEWNLPTGDYLSIRDAGKPGTYKIHGHCLAWINQTPPWMRQIIPENITSMQWSDDGLFYAGGNNASGPFQKVNKITARRIYFNHILYEMRHFMTTDARYGSSKERGVIPFHSFDVVNVEIHESRYSVIIKEKPDEWKTTLRHISWLMAMTDNDFNDIKQNYIYLLFKYAHIAVPNAQMAEKYKAGYNDPNIVPDYMKKDGHDNGGSIDAYISEKPPFLVYNDYEIATWSKARVAYNMIRELNETWKTDPLYDGRNLIECLGIQGHEMVSPEMVSHNQRAAALFASLIDEGLLDYICYSELDIKQADSAPGGEALAPAVLNQKQADAIGYQYALLFKMFKKYKKYIDHVIIWSQFGSSWMNSYVLFDHEQMASQAYYGVMDPDRFILGHSYLDSYFAGEYDKLKDG